MASTEAQRKERLNRVLTKFKAIELAHSPDIYKHYDAFPHGNEAPGKPPGFLNSGGFGETFSLKDKVSGETLILKMIPKSKVFVNDDAIRHFSVELAALDILSNPKINKKRGLFHTANTILVVLDTAKATALDFTTISTLREVWRGNLGNPTNLGLVRDLWEFICQPRLIELRTLNKIRIRIIMKQILLGLQYLHHGSIIHRDIKPENVVVGVSFDIKTTPTGGKRITERFDVKIIDFGLAKLIVSEWQSQFTTPNTGMMSALKQSVEGQAPARQPPAATTANDDEWEGELDTNPQLQTDFNDVPVLNTGYGTEFYKNCDDIEGQLGSQRKDRKFVSSKKALMKADVYAAGITFYYMLHRTKPFSMSHSPSSPEDLRKLQALIRRGPVINSIFCDAAETVLLQRMLSPDPNQCPTVDELLKDPYFEGVGDSITYTELKEVVKVDQSHPEPAPVASGDADAAPAPEAEETARQSGGQDPMNAAVCHVLDDTD